VSNVDSVFLLTSNNGLTSSLKRHLRHARGLSEDVSVFDVSHLVPEEDRMTQGKVLPTYRQIARRIESARDQDPSGLRNLVVIADLYDKELSGLEDLNPISREYGWAAVVSMLILAFPEAHWILHTPYGSGDSLFTKAHLFATVSSLSGSLAFHQHGFRNLLDGTGLRDGIFSGIANIKDNDGNPVAPVRRRLKTAAAIDEEEAYAYFNAYTARRFGYCAWSVDSWNLMQEIFREGSPGIHLLLEDLYLNFPDKNSDISLSDLKTRDKGTEEIPGLQGLRADSVERRVLITVGHRGSHRARENWRKNKHYLRSLRSKEGRDLKIKVLYKPLSGIFNLWEEAGMLQWNRLSASRDKGSNWPPNYRPRQHKSTGHSSPGRLLEVAEQLIERSKSILEEARNVPDAVHAATLALDAKELLAGKTPTTALKALALQHRAEVRAESMFHGIEFNLDVRSRFRDLREEVDAIGRWFSGRRRKRVTLNARLAIIEDLAREFSELDQFEEERKCRAEARRLYFDFWAHQSPWRLLFLPLLRYLSFSLRSLPVFLGLVLFWILLFGVGWDLLEPTVNVGTAVPDERYRSLLDALTSSTVYFFTLTPPGSYWGEADRQVLWNLFLVFQGVVSLSHLGLLVSHIYLIVSRR